MTAVAVVKATATAVAAAAVALINRSFCWKAFSGRVSGEKSFGYDLDFAVEIFQVSMI